MRVETHLEGSSVFLYVSKENDDAWPLRLRNDTDLSLAFQQMVSVLGFRVLDLQSVNDHIRTMTQL